MIEYVMVVYIFLTKCKSLNNYGIIEIVAVYFFIRNIQSQCVIYSTWSSYLSKLVNDAIE